MSRMSERTRKISYETQVMVLDALKKHSALPLTVHNKVIETMASDIEGKTLDRLGSVGKILKKYANRVTLRHPDMSAISNMENWDGFSRDVFQALAADDKEVTSKLENNYKSLVRNFISPKPRFIENPDDRFSVRGEKNQTRHVNLKQVYMLGENGFYSKPDNFKLFTRHSDAHLDEIKKLDDQAKLFSSIQMNEVAHTVKKQIASLEEMQGMRYLGFHRMKPVDAAIISARVHGLKWHEVYFLHVPFNFFEEVYWISPTKKEEQNDYDMKRLLVMKDRKMAFLDAIAFSYQPRLYPLAHFSPPPDNVKNILLSVESMPELNGCPAFDYYWVLMPSININHPFFKHKNTWSVRVRGFDEQRPWNGDKTWVTETFSSEFEAAKALDKVLYEEGYFKPVVLGERDGKCYFLCVWE